MEVHRQIVAGTNFRLKLRLRNRIAPDCNNDEVFFITRITTTIIITIMMIITTIMIR